MKKHHVRILSMLIAVIMLIGAMSLTALADGNGIACTDDNCDHVAAIDSMHYDTLQDAVDAVTTATSTTITLRKNAAGNGVVVPSGCNITFDLNSKTYTIDSTVGSTGTETNGFQLLRDSTITFKNGSITSTKAKILIQNYSNLTLDEVTLNGTRLVGSAPYTLSNNFGNVVIRDSKIMAKAGGFAFDLYYWPEGGYSDGVSVTVEGSSEIEGNVEYGGDDTITECKATLNIAGGTFDGKFKIGNMGDDAKADIVISGGQFTENVSAYIIPGMKQDAKGNIVVDPEASVAVVDGVGYTTLAAAVNALKNGSIMEILPGEHDVTTARAESTYGSGLIIDKNDITIKAADPENKPVIYGFSNKFSAGVGDGGINGQDTIYVSGKNVTLENLKIMPLGGIGPNANNWQKTVEVTSAATGFTMTGCETLPNNMKKDGVSNSMKDSAGNIHVSINDADISGNSFGTGTTISAGWTGSTAAEGTYSVDVSGNYWGEGATAATIADAIDGNVNVDTYYTDAAMTETATIGGIPVATSEQLTKAITSAKDGDTIVLAHGTYNCNISFGGKSLTLLGANAGVNPNTDARGPETIFTGTISTSDGSDKFYPEQEVVIDGFKFTGDGLKVGDNNYNSVGNLIVENCIMETGENLSGNTCGHNSSNYFVKVSGGAAQGFANVIVRNNLVTGKPVDNVFPIQLWHVKQALVVNNVIDLDDAAGHEAISISILHPNAVVDVSGNTINGCGGSIYVTNWKVNGQNEDTPDFTGIVAINNNTITGPESNFDPIFVGYEGAQNGDFAGTLFAGGNTYNDANYVVTATRKPGSTVESIDVVLKDGKEVVDYFTGPKTDDGLTVTLRTLSKKGYTFLGWRSSTDGKLYKGGKEVTVYRDTTFTAQWMSNWEIVDDIAGAAGSGKEFFTDVKGSAWYYDAVKFVYDNGFMDGVGDNKFNPNGTLTRAMIAQVLYNLEGETGSYPTVFDDVAKSAWYADAVNWAAASGIVEGKGNNKFDPNAAITRQEMAAILYRYSDLKGYDVSDVDSLRSFTDASKVASWAKEAMGWAVENYVINGKGNGTLDPTGTATRAEVAQILMNLCNNVL